MSNVSTTGLHEKVKGKAPSVYQAGEDIWLWFLELDDYFNLRHYMDPELQAKCAATYLSEFIYRCIKRLRVAGDREPFCTWTNLQA